MCLYTCTNYFLKGGGNAEYVASHESLLMPIPQDMSFTQAAAIPEVWLTAFQLLHTVGQSKILLSTI